MNLCFRIWSEESYSRVPNLVAGILLNLYLKKWFAPLIPRLGFSNLMFVRMCTCVRAHGERQRERVHKAVLNLTT